MLDTILYQSFIKSWLIPLLQTLVGLKYTSGSGHLDAYPITSKHCNMTYSEVFRYLSRKYGCVVLGIYRHLHDTDCLPKSLLPFLNDCEDESNTDERKNLLAASNQHRAVIPSMLGAAFMVPFTPPSEPRQQQQQQQSNMKRSSSKNKTGSGFLGTMRDLKAKFTSDKKEGTVQLREKHHLHSTKTERENLDDMIEKRMKDLHLSMTPTFSKCSKNTVRNGYILLNPSGDTKLEKNDILYILVPEQTLDPTRSQSYNTSLLKSASSFMNISET